MKRVLILGANGQIAQWVVSMLAQNIDIQQTLFVRDPSKINYEIPSNAAVVRGDVLDASLLNQVMKGHDIVYANLSGNVDLQAKQIIQSMKYTGISHLIFINSLGIYKEVPGKFGEWNEKEIGEYLGPYRRAADLIEDSSLGVRAYSGKKYDRPIISK